MCVCVFLCVCVCVCCFWLFCFAFAFGFVFVAVAVAFVVAVVVVVVVVVVAAAAAAAAAACALVVVVAAAGAVVVAVAVVRCFCQWRFSPPWKGCGLDEGNFAVMLGWVGGRGWGYVPRIHVLLESFLRLNQVLLSFCVRAWSPCAGLLFLLLRPNRSSILLAALHACPFHNDQHIDAFVALSAADSVLGFVVAASVNPFHSPIDFACVRGLLTSTVSATACFR